MALSNVLKVKIQSPYYTEEEWINEQDRVLLKGEVAYTVDNGLYKIGTGDKLWSELEYSTAEIGTISTEQIDALFE